MVGLTDPTPITGAILVRPAPWAPCSDHWQVDVAERGVTKKWLPLACLIPFRAPATR